MARVLPNTPFESNQRNYRDETSNPMCAHKYVFDIAVSRQRSPDNVCIAIRAYLMITRSPYPRHEKKKKPRFANDTHGTDDKREQDVESAMQSVRCGTLVSREIRRMSQDRKERLFFLCYRNNFQT